MRDAQRLHEGAIRMTVDALAADSAADLRAEVARRQVQIYRLAPLVGLHPSHLGQILRGRRPLPPGLAERIRGALSGAAGAEAAGLGDGRAA